VWKRGDVEEQKSIRIIGGICSSVSQKDACRWRKDARPKLIQTRKAAAIATERRADDSGEDDHAVTLEENSVVDVFLSGNEHRE
jgi:hypothetical protein